MQLRLTPRLTPRLTLWALGALLATGCGSTPAATTAASTDAADIAADSGADTTADTAIDTAADTIVDSLADAADQGDASDALVGPDAQADSEPADTKIDLDYDADGIGQMCKDGDTCPGGLTCWMPKPVGGPMPMGTCVPPLGPGDCYDDTPCGGGYCFEAELGSGSPGRCLPKVAAGQCWPTGGTCYPGSSCEGATVCPKGAACIQADKPGTCAAGASNKGGVYLWNPGGSLMIPGSVSQPTWVNYSDKTVFLPGCTTWNTEQKQDNGTWKNLGPPAMCAWEGLAVPVPPGGYHQDLPWTAPQSSGVGMTWYRFSGSYALGCQPDKALSQAGCTSTVDVVSDETFVGYPP